MRLYGSISYMHKKEVGYFEALKSLNKIQEEEDNKGIKRRLLLPLNYFEL